MQETRSDGEQFLVNRVLGNIAKEIVRGLLDESGYRTYPYGYESFLSEIRTGIREMGPRNSEPTERIRSHPDLVVYDNKDNVVEIVEVKYRRPISPTRVGLKRRSISWYQKYWNDAVLVLVVPVGKVFYAQRISELPGSDLDDNQFMDFHLDIDFLPIPHIFSKVQAGYAESPYARLAKRIYRIAHPRDEG